MWLTSLWCISFLFLLTDGRSSAPTDVSGVHRLVKQITDLQSKNAELHQRALTAESVVEEQLQEIAGLKQDKVELQRKRNELQENIVKARSSKVRTAKQPNVMF